MSAQCLRRPHQMDVHNRQSTRQNGSRLPPGSLPSARPKQKVIITVQRQTTEPCLPSQVRQVPAARCAGSLRAQSPGPSSTTIRRRQEPSTDPYRSSTGGASTTISRARRGTSVRPRFVALTSAIVRSSTRSRPTRPATAPEAIRPRASRGRPARGGCFSAHPASDFAQRACQREQYRTRRERDHHTSIPHEVAARIDDKGPGGQKRFDHLEQEGALLPARYHARHGRIHYEGCAFDLRGQGGQDRVARGVLGPSRRRARRRRVQTSNRDTRNSQLIGGPRCRRERRGVELCETCARPRRGGRSGAGAEPQDCAHARNLCSRHRLRASRALRRALSGARTGRARRVRFRPPRRHTAREPPSVSGRRPHRGRRRAFARTRSPSCAITIPRSASAGASRAGRRASMRRGGHLPRVRAPRR